MDFLHTEYKEEEDTRPEKPRKKRRRRRKKDKQNNIQAIESSANRTVFDFMNSNIAGQLSTDTPITHSIPTIAELKKATNADLVLLKEKIEHLTLHLVINIVEH